MTAVTCNSFTELAKLFGQDVAKEELKIRETAWESVKVQCGRPAAAAWAYLNDKAESKASPRTAGDKGSLFGTPDEIANVLGLDKDTVVGGLVRLLQCGLAKLGPNDTIAVR